MPNSADSLFANAMQSLKTNDHRNAISLLEQAALANHLEAMVQAGHVYVQNSGDEFPSDAGFQWYLKAAQQGYAPAQCRVADCYMSGLGVALDDRKAFYWYEKVAQQGLPFALSNLAYMYQQAIGTERDTAMAMRYYLLAAMLGDGFAFCELSLAFLSGQGVTQDSNMAMSFAMLAKAIAYPDAQTLLGHVIKHNNASTATWFEALKHTIMKAQSHLFALPIDDITQTLNYYQPVILHYLKELNPHLLDFTRFTPDHAEISAQPPKLVCKQPEIITIEQFLSPSLCCYLMHIAKDYLDQADQLHQSTLTDSQTFEGGSAVFSAPRCDAILRHLERRIAHFLKVSTEQLEPLSVLWYVKGEQYAPHVDYFDEKRLTDLKSSNPRSYQAGQRIYTFLVYLSPAIQGGETCYLKANKKVSGIRGQAVIHANCKPDGQVDPDSLHQGLPVIAGDKWLLRCAVRINPLTR